MSFVGRPSAWKAAPPVTLHRSPPPFSAHCLRGSTQPPPSASVRAPNPRATALQSRRRPSRFPVQGVPRFGRGLHSSHHRGGPATVRRLLERCSCLATGSFSWSADGLQLADGGERLAARWRLSIGAAQVATRSKTGAVVLVAHLQVGPLADGRPYTMACSLAAYASEVWIGRRLRLTNIQGPTPLRTLAPYVAERELPQCGVVESDPRQDLHLHARVMRAPLTYTHCHPSLAWSHRPHIAYSA